MFNDKQKRELLSYARNVIRKKLTGESYLTPEDEAFSEHRGIFVTLQKRGNLRGCIGYIRPYKNILDSIHDMALAAAFEDPRFAPLGKHELDDISIEISILSPMKVLTDTDEIEIGRDGLYLQHPHGSGLLLPQVAPDWGWNKEEFLRQICHKASLPAGSYLDSTAKLFSFTAEIFSEEDFSN